MRTLHHKRRLLHDSLKTTQQVDRLYTPLQPEILLEEDFAEDKALKLQQKKIEEIKRLMKHYKAKPLDWFHHELGIPTWKWNNDLPPSGWKPSQGYPLWSKQQEIVEAIVKYKRVCVRSCHGPGKTFVAAGLSLYFPFVHHALGITTAPTGRQVKLLLWQEIADLYNRANAWRSQNNKPPLGGRLLTTALQLGDKWYVEGFATDQKEVNMPGFHEEVVFAMIDEACGCSTEVFQAVDSIMTGENCYVLAIGNPVDPNTEFKRLFNPNSGYYPIHISAFDIPNVKHKKIIFPKLTTLKWVEERREKWREGTPLYESKVLGNFPKESTEGLIPYNKVMNALERQLPADKPITYGVDPARLGGDRIVGGIRYASGLYKEIMCMDRKRLTETAGRIQIDLKEIVSAYNEKVDEGAKINPKEDIIINVDDIGVGGGVTDILYEQEYAVNGINVAESSDEDVGEVLDIEFVNKRAFYYWKLRVAFCEDKIAIDDEELAEELLSIETKITSKGKIGIIEKDKIKAKLGRSPDKAEALMMAWSEESTEDTHDFIRVI